MKASRKLLLASAALIAPVMAAGAAAAADLPIMAAPETYGGWYLEHSVMEFGGQVFIDRPGSGPSARSDNLAKFNEYGNRTDSAFLTFLDIGLATKDGHYTADVRAKNVGQNNQDIELELSQPGEHYLTLGWDQTPHLRSVTAQTIFNNNGNSLTVPDAVVQSLYNEIANGSMFTTGAGTNSSFTTPKAGGGTSAIPNGCFLPTQTPTCNLASPATNNVQTTILQNVHGVTLGLQRDRGEVAYRWTPSPEWNINVDYSNEHRFGLQEQGFLFSSSTSTPMAQVAAPVDDTTQDASISAEYAGYSPWGMRWNGILKYDASIYTDKYTAFAAENPFGGPGSPANPGSGLGTWYCPVATSTTVPNCYGVGQEGTAPNNQSNAVSATVGIDLPWFKQSRYIGTFNYNMMTQNASFIPMTINPATTYALSGAPSGTLASPLPVPRGSLNGEIDTLLFNNVLTSEITSDVKNKLSYRYYSNKNTTPSLTLQNWVMNDSVLVPYGTGGTEYAPHTTLFSSYTKQNASDEVTWHALKWANVGISGGWEQYQYSQYAANQTNEYNVKVFADATPTDWLTVRASDAASWRRYNNYNWQAYIGNEMLCNLCSSAYPTINNTLGSLIENPLLRDLNIANRDRNLARVFFDITTPIQGLTVTPTASLRWDDYPTDTGALTTPGQFQLGMKTDHNWNAGIEANYSLSSSTTLTASYTYERSDQTLIGDGSSSTAVPMAAYQNKMLDGINTWLVAANIQLIPDRLNLKLSGTYEKANDSWNITGEPGCSTASTTGCGASANNPAYPPVSTNFYHADAVLTYKIDPAIMTQFGSKGEAFLKLHYMWERNSVTNWQNDSTQVYMYQELNSNTIAFKDQIFLAGDNPNYNAQALLASIVVKW